jgi:hypothetical protein
MLLLWDHVILGRLPDLQRLDRSRLGELSIRSVEGTLSLFEPPFQEYFPPATAMVVQAGLVACRAAAPTWHLDRVVAEAFYDRSDNLPRVPIRPGVGPFVTAVNRLVEAFAGVLDENVAMEIMSSCYESVMLSQLSGRITIDMQRENSACQNVLQLQDDLIGEYAPHR